MATDGSAAAGAVTQLVGRLGHIEPFDESTSDWPSYEERLTSFLLVNRIPEDDKMFPTIKVMPTTLKLRTFQGAIVQPVGVAHVAVQYGEQRAQLPLYITKEKGLPLLGRQWLQAIRLNRSSIFKLNAISRGSPKWVRGTVLKKTGPVSYKVPVSTPRGKFIWRRHFDQLLGNTSPKVTPGSSDVDNVEGFLLFPPNQTGDQPASEEPVLLQPPEVPPAPAPTSETSALGRRYPSRNRRPPERYEAGF
ncbi:hypothetical protein V5799_008285 [Amblyomma americanum]|uniref:Uncharacterized protein n=1 Tax=Amblyomma americanum TaxID=6943 RepID=A0AAQ4FDU7_AMBAM